jgi:COG4 transport protein
VHSSFMVFNFNLQDASTLLDSIGKYREKISSEESSSEENYVNVNIPQFNISLKSPTQEIAKNIHATTISLIQLDNVLLLSKELNDKLVNLSKKSNTAVHSTRKYHELGTKLLSLEEKVENIIELRNSFANLHDLMDSSSLQTATLAQLEKATMYVKRLFVLHSKIPFVSSDLLFLHESRKKLLTMMLSQLDISLNEYLHNTRVNENLKLINMYCQLLSVLGYSKEAFQRYVSFSTHSIKTSLQQLVYSFLVKETSVPPISVAKMDIFSAPGTVINLMSTLFMTSISALENANKMKGMILLQEKEVKNEMIGFDDGNQPTSMDDDDAIVVSVASVADIELARILSSFLNHNRIDRLKRYLDELMDLSSTKKGLEVLMKRSGVADSIEQNESLSENLVSSILFEIESQLKDERNSLPLLMSKNSSYSSVFSTNQLNPSVSLLEASLEELVILLRRCGDYQKLVLQKIASKHDSTSSSSSYTIATTTSGSKYFKQLREAKGDVSMVFVSFQIGLFKSSVSKAFLLEEIIPNGISGASIDLRSFHTLASLTSSSTSTSAPSAVSNTASLDPDSASSFLQSSGTGAPISTLIEDCFYIASAASSRAFNTLDATAITNVINLSCQALLDVLLQNLQDRANVCSEWNTSGGSGGSGGAASLPTESQLLSGTSSSSNNHQGASVASKSQLLILRDSLMQSQLIASPNVALRLAEFQATLVEGSSSGQQFVDLANPSYSDEKNTSSSSTSSSVVRLQEDVVMLSFSLNNLQLAFECLSVFERELVEKANQVSTDLLFPEDISKIHACITMNTSPMKAQLKSCIETSLSLLSSKLTPRLRSAMNIFEGSASLIQYELKDDGPDSSFPLSNEFDTGSATISGTNSAFSAEFLPALARILSPFQYLLSPALSSLLVMKVATYVAKQLEPRIRRKKFTLLGGLQFDSDIRALVSFFTLRSTRKCRDKFVRLLQIATVLNLESPHEFIQYWNRSSGSNYQWQVSVEEVKAIMALRVDFSSADIAKVDIA